MAQFKEGLAFSRFFNVTKKYAQQAKTMCKVKKRFARSLNSPVLNTKCTELRRERRGLALGSLLNKKKTLRAVTMELNATMAFYKVKCLDCFDL